MKGLAVTLGAQHRACDELFADAENRVGDGDMNTARERLAQFVDQTDRHFRREEEVLFPAFEERTGHTMGPTQVMRGEHAQMRQLFGDLGDALEQGDGERFLGLSETLLILMQQHNAKEEQVLYPMVENVLSDRGDELLQSISEI